MPRQPLEEITATFLGERPGMRWDGGTFIGQAKVNDAELGTPAVTIKGQADEDELTPGLSYRFYGRWVEHPRHGRQFHFQTFVTAQPHGRRGVITYIQQAPNIGPAIAESLWKRFQGEAVHMLREEPEFCAANIRGLTTEKAIAASAFLTEQQSLEGCSIDLIELLGKRGFPKKLVRECVKTFGNRAAELIEQNPYLLMRFRGCGFLRCDQLYLDLGKDPARLKRQAYCAWHSVATDTEGHTWHFVNHVADALAKHVSGANVNAPLALAIAKRGKLIDSRRDESNRLWIAEGRRARNEKAAAQYLAEAIVEGEKFGSSWPDVSGSDELSDHQKSQAALATAGLVGILAGSPGTGKSYTAAAIIRRLMHEHGSGNVAVCAPTGKAAVRVTEAMEKNGVTGLKARTIHSTLGVVSGPDGSGWAFNYGQGNPLPFRFIVVDESSMIDTDLMASLLAARGTGTHILFIGDPYQLPPVGHGAPLRDMIVAGLPYGELKEIRRNSGAIVRACAEIRDHGRFTPCKSLNVGSGDNLICVDTHSPEKQIAQVDSILEKLRAGGQVDPVWDVQILVPVNEKSPLARKTLNLHLQGLLNPAGESADGNPFKVADKVICTKNGFLPSADQQHPECNEDGKVFVANGEMGKVIAVEAKLTTISLASPDRVVKVPRGGQQKGAGSQGEGDSNSSSDEADSGSGCDWDLAYAISVHKSQGSEWPLAIVMIDDYPGARMVCSKNWIYTAISRAKEACILIGKIGTANGFCKRDALWKRKTFLAELVGQCVVEERAAELVGVGAGNASVAALESIDTPFVQPAEMA